eukprot:Gb_08432 [translate_table: standard]
MFFWAKKSTVRLFTVSCKSGNIAQFWTPFTSKPHLNPLKTLHIRRGFVFNTHFLGNVNNSFSKSVEFSAVLSKRVFSVTSEGVKNEEEMEKLAELSDLDCEEEAQALKNRPGSTKDEVFVSNVERILGILKQFESLSPEARLALDKSGVIATSNLAEEVLCRLRNDWKSSFTFFLWAGMQPGYWHTLRTYHTMISILAKLKRFDIAWGLIKEMQNGANNRSMVTRQTLLIMIRRYAAAHDVGRAIKTFHAMEKFKFKVDINAFQDLLSALCRYKNVEEAEQLLYFNKNVFDFETKSFNIVLNGWCNMVVSVAEAKRFWRDMINKGITPDAFSYSSMICCFSKAGNLHDVLRLFDEMKRRDCVPDLKVYNAVVYALAKGKCVKEAYNLFTVMTEKGFNPDAVSYNSLIKPLCKARRVEDAHMVFDEMVRKGHAPSIRTYHAFFNVLKDSEEILKLLEKMIGTDCTPTIETYIMLIRKFCRWGHHEKVFKLWNDMEKHGLSPDRSAYIVLIHGLFLNSKLEEACKYYEEMKAKGFLPEPKTDEMLKAWIAGREAAAPQLLELKEKKAQEMSKRRERENTSALYKVGSGMPNQPKKKQLIRGGGFGYQKQQNKGKFYGGERFVSEKQQKKGQFNRGKSFGLQNEQNKGQDPDLKVRGSLKQVLKRRSWV